MGFRIPGLFQISRLIGQIALLRSNLRRLLATFSSIRYRHQNAITLRKFLLISVLLLHPVAQAVQVIDFSQLNDPRAPALAYGEVIQISSEADETKIQGEPVTDWIDLKKVFLEYRLAGENPNEREARVAADGFWAVDIDPLPRSSRVQLNWRFEGAVNSERAAKLVDEILIDEDFQEALQAVLNVEGERTDEQAKKDLAQFAEAIERIIDSRLPGWLKPIEGQTALVDSNAVEKSLATHFGSITGRLDSLRRLFSSLDLSSFSNARKSLDGFQADTDGKKRAVKQYIEDYDQLLKAFQSQVTANVEMRAPVTQSAAVSDLLRYAGIDMAATYAPDIDEFLKFITVNIYFGLVEDKPRPIASSIGQRLSLTVGFGSDAISNNDNSEVKGDDVYMLGLGWRINKYFRASFGELIYRNNDNDLDTDEYISISLDLTAFDQLSSLVSK